MAHAGSCCVHVPIRFCVSCHFHILHGVKYCSFFLKRKDSQVNLNPLFPAPTELQTLVLKPVTSPSLDMTQSQPGKLLYSYDCSKSLYVQI